MPLMNINSDWMSNASSGLCIILVNCISCISCISYIMSKVTAPQDAHKQFSAAGLPWLKHFRIQWYIETLSYQNAVHWYLAKRLLLKGLPSREEPDISLSIGNSKAGLNLLTACYAA